MKKFGAWVQSNLGASIVGGLVVGGVLWLGSRVASDVPLLAVVIGVAVAIVLGLSVFSVVNRKWRGRTWGWLFGLRLLTRKKREELIELGYLRRSNEQTIKDAEMRAAAEKSSKQVQEFMQGAFEKAKSKAPALPPPAPRWTISRIGDENTSRQRRLRFTNLMPGSVALGVRVEPRANYENAFQFVDEGYWPDLSGKCHGEFNLVLRDQGAHKGFALRLTWLDDDMDTQLEDFWIAPSEADPDDPWNAPF